MVASVVLAAGFCLAARATAQPLAGVPATAEATAAAEPFTLAAALAQARNRAPVVKAAEVRATAQGSAAEATRRWRSPTLDLSIENLGPQDLDHDGFVWFTQPLDVGARRSTRIAAAQALRDTLTREVDVQRRGVDSLVVEAYLGVVSGRQTTELLAAHEKAVEDVVQLLQRRVQEGVAPEGDLRKLEAERARVGLTRVRADLAMRQQAVRLAALTGEDAATLVGRVTAPSSPPVSSADVDAAIEGRADVRAALARLDERRTVAAAERALGGTAWALTGGYKRTAGFNTGTAGISIDLPIGARNAPARLRAEAEVTAAQLELEQVRTLARAEIDQALLAARLLSAQAERVATELVRPAIVAQRAARAGFREGTGDALALVDADRVYLDSQREALAVQLDAAAASIRARLALGEDPLP